MESIQNYIHSIAPIFAVIGTYLLILSYQKKNEIQHTLKHGQNTEGVVIDLVAYEGADGRNDFGFAPVVEFTTVNGTYKHYSNTYQNPSPYSIGQKVKIYYYIYKSRHEFALEDDKPGTLPDTLFLWGLVFCVVGYPFIFLKLLNLF